MKKLTDYLNESTGDTNLVVEFFFLSRNSATLIHYKHLTTESYAQHSALGDFYNGIIGLVDSFMESYIGKFGKLPKVSPTSTFCDVKQYRDWVNANRLKLTDSSDLQNILDEIITLCDSTLYKLEQLH